MKIISMHRLTVLLVIGILWFGGLHPNFAVAGGHINLQGQTGSMCDTTHSTDNSCLIHSNQLAIAQFASPNFRPSVFKTINSFFNTSLPISYNGQQVRQNFLEPPSTNGIKLTGTVIKRE